MTAQRVTLAPAEALRLLHQIRGFFGDGDDPAMQLENWKYRVAMDMAIAALKAALK